MSGFFGFIGSLIWLAIVFLIIAAIILFIGYNSLRALSEKIKEAWSNIGVVGKKQASLVNQLIDVVKGYQESEKLVVMKLSEDMTSTSNVAQMHQLSGVVLSSVNRIASAYPELKADQQYNRLIDSIQSCELNLESSRSQYNQDVRKYNTKRSSIPEIFYASKLGFNAAPYLEFNGIDQITEIGTIKDFASDIDGAHIQELLNRAGSKLIDTSAKTIEAGKSIAGQVIDNGRSLINKDQPTLGDDSDNSKK